MNVGLKIKDYIVENGIKQSYLAKVTNISESKLNLTLNGKRRLKFEEYEVICWCLGVNTDKFVKPREPKRQEKKGA